jgi:hypothetical protein
VALVSQGSYGIQEPNLCHFCSVIQLTPSRSVTVQLYKWDGNYEMLIVATTIYGAQSHLQLGSTNMVFGCQLAAFRCVHYSHYWLKHLQTAKPLQSYMKTWLELNLTSAVVFGKLLIPTSSLRTKSTATTILHQPWLPPVILHAHINNELVVCSFTQSQGNRSGLVVPPALVMACIQNKSVSAFSLGSW